ncbi:TRAP transporter large permease [Desulfofundulus thermosubterraneus]|uniref:TRAP transporter, DctM subunit n=1 Tax=Desulfofundulus thermosubterraneus DSM 16057 TaxID=1121432 RepID=A0A1M6M4X5_9FIRM|nr:TRAP transporter large permease [Desulfofundulus thermosubterraneus]SHJ78518.1 TRAP transporter, DctM subunit [Desulfofundulus thermosubterraneus DSM 16057]
MALGIFFASLFALLALGIPIAVVLVLCAVALMLFLGNFDAQIIAQNMVYGANSFPLMAIPFFMLAGEIMAYGSLSQKIVDFATMLVGRIRGGLGYVVVLASILFAGLSGSAVADAAALGSILVPLMAREGYRRDVSTALVASSGIIAPIIPPSIPMIIFGVTSGVSITKLFMSGIIPGLILGLILMVTWTFLARKGNYPRGKKYSRAESLKVVKESVWALLMPIIIVGGIRFGVFTPTEAGAVAVVYALVVSMFIYRDVNLKDLKPIFIAAAKSTSVVMFVASAAMAVAWLLTVAQIPNQMAQIFGGLTENKLVFLVAVNVFLLFLGMIMDLTPAILIFTPVLMPLVAKAGIDPVYFGLIMVFNLCIGLITPPIGTVLYVGCGVGQINFIDLTKKIWPFLIAEIIVLILLILFPDLVMVPLRWFAN